MAALRTERVPQGQKGQEGQAPFCLLNPDPSLRVDSGTKGTTPFRGVPIVPEPSAPLVPVGVSSVFADADEAAAFCERAAIREYDGGLPRAAAERLAWLDVIDARTAQPLAQAV